MLWICKGCTAAYSVGAPACPQCGADDHIDEGAAATPTEGTATAADAVEAEQGSDGG